MMNNGRRTKAAVKHNLGESVEYANDVTGTIEGRGFANQLYDQDCAFGDEDTYLDMSASTPPPCPGSTFSSVDSLTDAKHLRDFIRKEIKEFAEPITDSLSKILAEMALLRRGMGIIADRVDVSCQTGCVGNLNHSLAPDECNAKLVSLNEPHYLCIDTVGTRVDSSVASIVNISKGNDNTNTETDLESEIPYIQDEEQMTKELKPIAQRTNKDTDASASIHTTPRQPIRFSNTDSSSDKVVFVTPRQKIYSQSRVYAVDDRESLANALQFHIEDLVCGLDFHESEVIDCLLKEECITVVECSSVKKLCDKKDQIRALLGFIKSRNIQVLVAFMKHIEQQNEDVAAKITRTFECYKRDGVKGKMCVMCSLERHINVKHIADSLWAIQVIDDGTYSRIVHSDAPVGSQGSLWKTIFHSLNCLNHQKAELAHQKLLYALSGINMFTHLMKGIQEMLTQNDGKFICTCEPVLGPSAENPFVSQTFPERLTPDPRCRHSETIADDFMSHNLRESDFDSVGKISRITERFKTKSSNHVTTAIDGADDTDNLHRHHTSTVLPENWLPLHESKLDSTAAILHHRTRSESQQAGLKASEPGVEATLTISSKSKPKLPKKPTWSDQSITDISRSRSLTKMTTADQDDHNIKEAQCSESLNRGIPPLPEAQCSESLNRGIPPLPVKRNKFSTWTKSSSESYFV